MTLYEVELRVQYRRQIWVEERDEDAAVENAVLNEQDLLQADCPGTMSGLDVQFYGIREVTKEEMEDA